MVDAAVAATRREYQGAVPVHVDLGLHSAILTRLTQAGQVQVDRAEVIDDCGIIALYDDLRSEERFSRNAETESLSRMPSSA